MDFGEWLKKTRESRGVDMRSFSQLIGVDGSTISRIENRVVEPTLTTVVRICESLDMSLLKLYAELQEKAWKDTTAPETKENGPFLRKEQVFEFLDTYRRDPGYGRQILAERLNAGFAVAYRQYHRKGTSLANGGTFTVEGVKQLINPKYHYVIYSIQEPPVSDPKFYRDIYRCGGVLVLEDLGNYLRILRRGQRQGTPPVSANVLSRLETGRAEQFKLRDLLALDNFFRQDGELIAMSGEAIKFLMSLEARDAERQAEQEDSDVEPYGEIDLANLYIKVHRWLELSFH